MGEAPGADEDRLGEPFVGRAGKLLTDIIEKGMQLKRSDVYILNVLKCRPPDNRTPTDEEVANCREYFERQLELLQPEFICCLGATAVRALLNNKQPLGRLRGQWFNYGNSRVIVTYHPSYLMRNPPAKKDTWQDIQLLMREMQLPIGKMN
jgi:DNA polymerase